MWCFYLHSANAPPEVTAATGAKALESSISSLDTANLDLSSPLVVDSTSAGWVTQMERRYAISSSSHHQSMEVAVRREKISQRMKLLQSLVPGCDKITGKALVLDEIINYVRFLQHQVEFLSMRLALVNPTLHDLDEECSGGHLEQQLQQETWNMSQASLSLQYSVLQATPTQRRDFDEATVEHPMVDNSAHLSLHAQDSIDDALLVSGQSHLSA
ncbi:hypothetical protein OPV22_029993 [Ensete ventricosum]|uniref:BHLH domain-containing protein n=1 Tax=Ensete ventricosum TaxID=4639 RepID=A0AAV8Q4X5_ENSVE|nr:hypothetical protein OPV22_029993 [Ensete ventricosum]